MVCLEHFSVSSKCHSIQTCWLETLQTESYLILRLGPKLTNLVCESCLIGLCKCKGNAVPGMTCVGCRTAATLLLTSQYLNCYSFSFAVQCPHHKWMYAHTLHMHTCAITYVYTVQ